MFQIDLSGAEPQWHKWPENADKKEQAQLLIVPFPASEGEMKMRRTKGNEEVNEFNLEIVQEGTANKKAFMYCLKDSKDLTDMNEQPINVNDKIDVPIGKDGKTVKMTVKEFIFDYCYDSGMPDFVLLKGKVGRRKLEDEKKS